MNLNARHMARVDQDLSEINREALEAMVSIIKISLSVERCNRRSPGTFNADTVELVNSLLDKIEKMKTKLDEYAI
jgi:hypothetical protein